MPKTIAFVIIALIGSSWCSQSAHAQTDLTGSTWRCNVHQVLPAHGPFHPREEIVDHVKVITFAADKTYRVFWPDGETDNHIDDRWYQQGRHVEFSDSINDPELKFSGSISSDSMSGELSSSKYQNLAYGTFTCSLVTLPSASVTTNPPGIESSADDSGHPTQRSQIAAESSSDDPTLPDELIVNKKAPTIGLIFRLVDQNVKAPGISDLCLRIFEVEREGPAARAGLRPGDFVCSIDGQSVHTIGDIASVLRTSKVGSVIRLTYVRVTPHQRIDLDDTSITVGSRAGEPDVASEATAAKNSTASRLSISDLSVDIRQFRSMTDTANIRFTLADTNEKARIHWFLGCELKIVSINTGGNATIASDRQSATGENVAPGTYVIATVALLNRVWLQNERMAKCTIHGSDIHSRVSEEVKFKVGK